MATESAACANCDTLRQGAYCYACGQNDRDYRRSLPPMLWDLLSEAFELDGRLVRTIRALLLRPGFLSTEFSANRRASYVSPIRLYLFSSILFFFTLSLTSDVRHLDLDSAIQSDLEVSSESIDQSRFRSIIDPDLQDDLDRILERNSLGAEILRGTMDSVNEDADSGKEPGVVGRFIYNQMIKALADPAGLFGDLFDNVPIALFFLLPVYAGILKLFYVRGGKYYVEHLVFALHLHAFAFVVFTIALFIPDAEEGWRATAEDLLFIGFFVYYFMALKRYYAQGIMKTAVKYFLLVTVYSICIAPAALLVLLVTLSLA